MQQQQVKVAAASVSAAVANALGEVTEVGNDDEELLRVVLSQTRKLVLKRIREIRGGDRGGGGGDGAGEGSLNFVAGVESMKSFATGPEKRHKSSAVRSTYV
jgi:hypothetical protein